MPSRVSARASTATSTRKSSAPPASVPVHIPEEPPLPSTSPELRANVIAVFADAQRSIAAHRKLVVRLRKIQENCCGIAKKDKKSKNSANDGPIGDPDGVAENEFNIEVARCVIRVLGVKKTEGAGDRIIKFLGTFLKSASDKDFEMFSQGDPDETQGFPETPTSRLTFNIVSTIVPILGAKEKMVRFRATQIISHIVHSLDSVDDELYHLVRQGLLKRIRDKEPTVRVQAVLGLGRLAGNEAAEDEDHKNDGAAALLEKLIEILQNDTSAEVRKSLLLNLPLAPETLPYLLERARDLDPATRRALYSRLLPTLGDFRHLSLSMREKLLRWGLKDRDENVRKATGRLFSERWVEDCAGTRNEVQGEKTGETAPPNIDALLELLERIDVVNSGIEGGTAHEAMRNFWEGRPDYRDEVTFEVEFWDSLTAESVFMARSFNDFCRGEANGKYEYLADEKLPEVTALAFHLEKCTNALIERIKLAKETGEGDEEETMEQEFIVEQLLYIALTLDYSDEVGRRKMFSLLREFLAVAELPDEITKLTVETLRSACSSDTAGESEFCGVVLEAVAEVHDNIVTEDSFVSAKSEISDESTPTKSRRSRNRSETPDEDEEVPFDKEEAKAKILREIMINMKCLHIAQCMLQNVEGNLQENINLVTMLNNLVVPAVRSHEAPIRERGLECLGLCCLLDKTLAEENMTLFIHCYNKGEEPMQATALQILSDILTTHPSLLLPTASQDDSNTVTPPVYQRPLLKVFAKALKPNSPQAVQTAAATSLSKLLLTNTLSPSGPAVPPAIKELNESSIETLLQSLVLSFFHPRTQGNLSLRQALAYFLPVYCHTRISNTQHMRKIAVSVVRSVLAAADEFYALEAEEDSDGDIDESVGEKEIKDLMTGVVGMLIEWTDERRVIGLGGEKILAGVPVTITPTGNVHLALIKDVLERVLGVGVWNSSGSKEEKKILLSILSKVSITPPPTSVGSRASSRAPEDDLRSSTQTRPSERGGSAAPAPAANADEEAAELAVAVKDLLDQAISDGAAVDASSRNALVKVKNVVLKLVAAAEATGAGSTTRSVRDRGATEDIMEEEEPEAETEAGEDVTRTDAGDADERSQSMAPSTAEEYEDAEEVTITGAGGVSERSQSQSVAPSTAEEYEDAEEGGDEDVTMTTVVQGT